MSTENLGEPWVLCGLRFWASRLNIRPLVRMLAQIPTGLHAGVGENRVDAGFVLGRVEDHTCLPVFLENGVVVIHRDAAVGVAVRRRTNTEHDEVDAEREKSHSQDRQQRSYENAPELFAKITGLGHGA